MKLVRDVVVVHTDASGVATIYFSEPFNEVKSVVVNTDPPSHPNIIGIENDKFYVELNCGALLQDDPLIPVEQVIYDAELYGDYHITSVSCSGRSIVYNAKGYGSMYGMLSLSTKSYITGIGGSGGFIAERVYTTKRYCVNKFSESYNGDNRLTRFFMYAIYGAWITDVYENYHITAGFSPLRTRGILAVTYLPYVVTTVSYSYTTAAYPVVNNQTRWYITSISNTYKYLPKMNHTHIAYLNRDPAAWSYRDVTITYTAIGE